MRNRGRIRKLLRDTWLVKLALQIFKMRSSLNDIAMESIPQFHTGASITNLLGLILHHGVDRRFWLRSVEAIMCSLLLTPFYFLESLSVRIVPRPRMHPAPVFVIGHWVSGTTYLHYVLSKDKQFACCTKRCSSAASEQVE